jgi:hypothetical protein
MIKGGDICRYAKNKNLGVLFVAWGMLSILSSYRFPDVRNKVPSVIVMYFLSGSSEMWGLG